MRCDKCGAGNECDLPKALSTLLDYIANPHVQGEIKDIISDYVEHYEDFED